MGVHHGKSGEMTETNKWIVMMTDFGTDNLGTAAMRGVCVHQSVKT